jgi:hypothetical protein
MSSSSSSNQNHQRINSQLQQQLKALLLHLLLRPSTSRSQCDGRSAQQPPSCIRLAARVCLKLLLQQLLLPLLLLQPPQVLLQQNLTAQQQQQQVAAAVAAVPRVLAAASLPLWCHLALQGGKVQAALGFRVLRLVVGLRVHLSYLLSHQAGASRYPLWLGPLIPRQQMLHRKVSGGCRVCNALVDR